MKLSVIVPVYNTEAYLEQCLESLVGQTLEDMEILVVNDGSPDNSQTIIDRFVKHYPGRVIGFQKENGGQASARNLALEYARGEYLGFVDSDDWVDLTMYEEMYAAALREDADIVICDTIDHYPQYDSYHAASRFDSKFKVTPSACNKLFRRETVGTDTFPEGLWYEDFEFTAKQLMKTEKIATVHSGFYHCHCREVSTMSNNNSLKNLDILTVLGNLEDYVARHCWQEKYGEILEYLYLDHVLITSVNRVEAQTNPDKQGVIDKMVQTVKEKYPRYWQDKAFLDMPRNRRIVARLNGMGLSKISKILINVKRKK